MTAIKPPKDHHNQLLVEGRDDVMAIGSLLARFGLSWPDAPWHPFINDAGGIDELLKAIPVAVKGSYRRLGVVLDADISLDDRWVQIRDRLQSPTIGLPSSPDPDGTVIHLQGSRLERVGIWLMPNNQSPGMLEDFLTSLVPPGDPVYPIAESSTDAALAAGAPLKGSHRTKGCIHSYLAWQDPSGMPFGTALTASVLLHDQDLGSRFVDWVRRLFE